MPNKNYNQYIFDTHFLELTKKFLATALFASIVKTFRNKSFIVFICILRGLRYSVCEYCCFAILDLPTLSKVTYTKINMILVLYCSRISLIPYFLNVFLLSETDTVENGLHFINFSFYIFSVRQFRIIRNYILCVTVLG